VRARVENSLSSILPIDRTPAAGDPPEKAQMFPLELNIDRVVSLAAGMKRLTVPSNDWILAHRANPYPPRYVVATAGFAVRKIRYAHSADPLVLRHEALRAAVSNCGPQPVDHASQVLLHEPIDRNGNPGLWEPGTGYRATVRQEGGPFTERSGFDIYDLGAFINQADGGDSARERELGHAPVVVGGPFLLEVFAYDDLVRARIGSVVVDGPRGTVREGRVALVASGPALFVGILVDALDIYAFEFVTSSFASFAAHMGTYDGRLPVQAAGALGGAPVPIGTVLACPPLTEAATRSRSSHMPVIRSSFSRRVSRCPEAG
jgi:hypothetical protein